MWLVVFGLIAVTLVLIMSLMERPAHETVQQRLQRLVRHRKDLETFVTRDLPGLPLSLDSEAEAKPHRLTTREAVLDMVERVAIQRRYSERLTERLQRAGWRWRPGEFVIAQALAGAVGLGGGLLVAPQIWWALLLMGCFTPYVLLIRAERKRLKAFEQQLPDALSIIANALRSGYSFLQAVDVVSREMPTPVSWEFGLILRENRVNIPLDDSLINLVRRVKSPDLDLVVTAVLIQRQVGGNLSEVLDKIGGTIKDRIRLQGEIRTLTTQGRISGWIVSLLPPTMAVAMQFVAPGFLNPLFRHPVGWALIGVGVIMQGIGILMIKSMVNLEV